MMLKGNNGESPSSELPKLVFREVPLYQLKEMQLTFSEGLEIVAALFHVILFNRAFGKVEPMEAKFDFLDIDYVKISNSALDKQVNENVLDMFKPCLNSDSESEIELHLTLSFYFMKEKKASLFDSQKCIWEQWFIPIKVLKEKKGKFPLADNKKRKEKLESMVQENLLLILDLLKFGQKTDYFPQFKKEYELCYPFEVSNTKTPNTLFHTIRKPFRGIKPQSISFD